MVFCAFPSWNSCLPWEWLGRADVNLVKDVAVTGLVICISLSSEGDTLMVEVLLFQSSKMFPLALQNYFFLFLNWSAFLEVQFCGWSTEDETEVLNWW